MGSNKFMLDLDAGETMDPPATAGRPDQKLMDVHPNQVQPYHYPTGLTGLSLQAREAKSNDWNASAADVRRALTGNIQRLTHLDIGPAKPATYFFRTGAGTEGILQLLSLVEEPKGIRVRYKTISSETTIATPKAIRHFATSDRVETIAYSADGKRIAIANGNATLILQTSGTSRVKDNWKPSVEILEADTGKPVVSLKLTTAEEDAVLAATPRVSHFEVSTLAFSPDGNVLAVGTRIGQVKLFNARNGELIRSLDDERARLADKETPENWKSLSRAIGSVASLAFSPDGSLLAVCGDSFAEFSDVFDGIEHLGLPVTGPGRLKVWEAKTVTLKHDLVGHSQAYAVAFSSDGSMLASAGRWADGPDHGNGVIIWNPQTGTKTRTILVEANGGTHSVAFSPNKKLMAFGSINFDKENDTSATSIGVAYPLSGITEWQQTIPGWSKPAFSSDGKVIAVLSGGQSIRFVDTETGALKDEIKLADSAPGGRWNDFSITRNGHRMAVAGIDAEGRGSVTVLDLGGALVGAP
jgi:WD40 repeat protein